MTENEMVGQHHQLSGHEFEHQETVKDREAWCAAVHGAAKIGHNSATELTDEILLNTLPVSHLNYFMLSEYHLPLFSLV